MDNVPKPCGIVDNPFRSAQLKYGEITFFCKYSFIISRSVFCFLLVGFPFGVSCWVIFRRYRFSVGTDFQYVKRAENLLKAGHESLLKAA